jgi:hypothetical protein
MRRVKLPELPEINFQKLSKTLMESRVDALHNIEKPELIIRLVGYVVTGQHDKAEAIASRYPSYMYEQITFKDFAGNQCKNMSALQYAKLVGNGHMLSMMESKIDDSHASKASQQLKEVDDQKRYDVSSCLQAWESYILMRVKTYQDTVNDKEVQALASEFFKMLNKSGGNKKWYDNENIMDKLNSLLNKIYPLKNDQVERDHEELMRQLDSLGKDDKRELSEKLEEYKHILAKDNQLESGKKLAEERIQPMRDKSDSEAYDLRSQYVGLIKEEKLKAPPHVADQMKPLSPSYDLKKVVKYFNSFNQSVSESKELCQSAEESLASRAKENVKKDYAKDNVKLSMNRSAKFNSSKGRPAGDEPLVLPSISLPKSLKK